METAEQRVTKWPPATTLDPFISDNDQASCSSSASPTNLTMADSCLSLEEEISSLCSSLSIDDRGTHDCRKQTVAGTGRTDTLSFLPSVNPKQTLKASPQSSETSLDGQESEDTTEATDDMVFQRSSSMKYMVNSTGSPTNSLDVANMQNKLSAQREFLMSSFKSPPRLPAEFSTGNIAGTSPPYKSGCLQLKVKDQLRKVGRAAKRFLHQNIVKRQQTRLQRCELCLLNLPEDSSQLILTITRSGPEGETHAVYFPPYLDSMLVLPKCLLPVKSREEVTITVYTVVSQQEGNFKEFSKICASGRCRVQADKVLVRESVELQHHHPNCALTGQIHSRTVATCTTDVSHMPPAGYEFKVTPKPIATDFTELLVLQTADPFQEHISLSSSTLDHPAKTDATLEEGKYYSACSYRLTRGDSSGMFAIHSASFPIFLKAYLNKTDKIKQCKKAAALTSDTQDDDSPAIYQLFLTKPPGFDMEDFLQACQGKYTNNFKGSSLKSTVTNPPVKAEKQSKENYTVLDGLHLTVHKSESGLHYPASAGDECDHIQVPSLTIFTMNTCLYFADFWEYYSKNHVLLVLCSKGSQAEQFCKQNLVKLDPYNNPFLYRKRVLFPEACVEVHTTQKLNVEILYVDSEDIKQHTLFCSENLFFSKVHTASS